MSLTVPKVRQRKFHTKTKSGCDQCRERHIRCGQEKPRCLNCQRRGLYCQWRQVTPKPVAITLSMDELRSFQFYRENTASDLRGLVDDAFWNSTLLLLSHGTKYLEHLVVSLSSLDEAFRLRTLPGQGDLALQKYSFSLKQYQQAIEGLIADTGNPTKIPVVLASCLVCIAIELWLGDLPKASQHAVAGYHIARTLSQPDAWSAPSDSITVTLLPSLWRFCAQLGVDIDEGSQPSTLAQNHPLLASVEQAQSDDPRSRFYYLLEKYLIEVDCTPKDQLKDGALRYLEHLKSWHEDAVTSNQKNSKDLREHHILMVHYYAIRAMLVAIITNDELQYDEHVVDFQQILDHCAKFLQLDRNEHTTVTTRRAPDVAVNMALLLVAWKCRQPHIRRQAIRQMYRSRRLEGIWSSTMLGILAEQLMALEEVDEVGASDSAATVVPPRRRLVIQSFDYEPGMLAVEGEKAAITSWAENPPTFVIHYGFPKADPDLVHEVRVHMRPYVSMGGFGMKSVFWWPIARIKTLLDEEIPEHTRTLDGPHLGYDHLRGHVRDDLRNLLYMRLMMLKVVSEK